MNVDKKLFGVSGVYLIRNTVTGDEYIGSSKNIGLRLHAHLSDMRNVRYKHRKMYELAEAHGVDSFEAEVLVECDALQLTADEYRLIHKIEPSLNQRLSIPCVERNNVDTNFKVAALRCSEREHEEFVTKRGSAWMRKVLRAAAKKEGAIL